MKPFARHNTYNPYSTPGSSAAAPRQALVESVGKDLDLIDEMIARLEADDPHPRLQRWATGFPSALLCVLAAGVLAGALAGRQVSGGNGAPVWTATQAAASTQPLSVSAPSPNTPVATHSMALLMKGRHVELEQLEAVALMSGSVQALAQTSSQPQTSSP